MIKDIKHLQQLIKHIKHVQDNCITLGEKLIENGEFHLGIMLIANGMQHDNSKFYGIEFDMLRKNVNTEDKTFLAALKQHVSTNEHHPEFCGGISKMSDIQLAEFVCDTIARASEFGTSYKEWVDTKATLKFGFTKDDEIYKRIIRFAKMLIDEPF